VIVSTDNLRAIADDIDEAGVSLDGFVLIAVQAEDGGRLTSHDHRAMQAQQAALPPQARN